MTNLNYTLPGPGTLTSHNDSWTLLFRDGDLDDEKLDLVAQVSSGDYLVTLATALDSLSTTLTKGNEPESAILQKHVDNLLYLDKKYKFVKK